MSDVNRGDIIVFRYPVDIKQTFVKRVMGVAGDRIRLENKKVWLNGHLLNEPYVVHKLDYIDFYRDNFPTDRIRRSIPPRRRCSSMMSKTAKWSCLKGFTSPWAIIATSRSTAATGGSCRGKILSASP